MMIQLWINDIENKIDECILAAESAKLSRDVYFDLRELYIAASKLKQKLIQMDLPL